jgi:hypothetical protein
MQPTIERMIGDFECGCRSSGCQRRAIPGSGGFGTITSLNSNISMRQLQVSLKLVF